MTAADVYRGQNPDLVHRIADALYRIDTDLDQSGGLHGRSYWDVFAALLIELPDLATLATTGEQAAP